MDPHLTDPDVPPHQPARRHGGASSNGSSVTSDGSSSTATTPAAVGLTANLDSAGKVSETACPSADGVSAAPGTRWCS